MSCTVVLKPAEQTPLTALMLARIFESLDLPRADQPKSVSHPSRYCSRRTSLLASGELVNSIFCVSQRRRLYGTRSAMVAMSTPSTRNGWTVQRGWPGVRA